MNCPIESRHPEILVDYAAGALDPEGVQALEEHFTRCTSCRSMAEDQKAVWLALDAWEAPAVSVDFDRRLYRQVAAGVRLSWWERISRPFRPMPLRQALPLTASVGLLLIAGLMLQHPRPEVPRVEKHEIVRANQLEKTLDDLDLLRQFASSDTAESVHRDAM